MPLNKLENFLKNTEGRILYVNPNDLDATDAIENQGNSLTSPFKTIQRALLESARFSYLRGSDNDLVEKTTILLFPGEYVIDNRPGFAIRDDAGTAKAVSPSGSESLASTTLGLTSESVFDLTQPDNILYKFNSINGGVIVPRGTSIVGLDLRKTKLKPKYVPNPTDSTVNSSAIFRVTGACYFWQFSFFDGDETGLVYTDDSDFSSNNQSKPTFSHHKLSCFEYADGVNVPTGFAITDLDMYYSKLSNAFNTETGRNIDQKWPSEPLGFSKQRPEWEIVGAFASDPINISTIISGDGATASTVITVTTTSAHNLTAGTPIKIKGVGVDDYNVSTKVQSVTSATQFTYLLSFVRSNLPASPSASSATVTIETDTVSGASPYIFNCSLRSVWGMNGIHADGAKASGFRSVVVAQFTAVSLQKDDRAFVTYNETSRLYEGISLSKVTGSALSNGSSSTNAATVYHLDSGAIYRSGWETAHIKASNSAFIQIVSVFAIGFTNHFDARSGSDYSVTNSNSNFGQIALSATGFRNDAFGKDNKGYITSIITPKAITSVEGNIDWVSIDVGLTTSVGISSHLYLYGFDDLDDKPPILIQGYRVGAKVNDKIYFVGAGSTHSASIYMVDNEISTTGFTTASGTTSSSKTYSASTPSSNVFTISAGHELLTGEKVLIRSKTGDLPEGIQAHRLYYVIKDNSTDIKLASSSTNADIGNAISVVGGSQLEIISRVSDKEPGEVGHPVQWDASNENWFVHTNAGNEIYTALNTNGVAVLGERTTTSFFKRKEDSRSIDEKLYKFRVVIPKEFEVAKDPEEGFVIQESSTTGLSTNTDFTKTSITTSDYDYNRNTRFISTCSVSSSTVTAVSELPHDLNIGDKIIIRNVTSTDNTSGTIDVGYNGTFEIVSITNDKTFTYSTTDVNGKVHTPGTFTNNTSNRTTSLPRFERNDWNGNYYIYRNDIIVPHKYNVQDGVYHTYVLNADNAIETEFTGYKYSQNVTDLYPQLDRDNPNDNPSASKTYAKRYPLGEVVTNDLKNSLTRETADNLLKDFFVGLPISSATASSAGISTITFSREHNLSGIVTYSAITGGTGYTNGTYYNVKLFNDGTSTWDGATAKVVVSGGSITSAEIIAAGSGYTDGEQLDFDTASIGGGTGAGVTISSSGISSVTGNTVQITGIGTATGGFYRITGVPSKNQISIGLTSGDPAILPGQYAINVAPEIEISSTTFTSSTGISTFTTSRGHGLVVGNNVRIIDSSHNNLGDYIVTNTTVTSFSAKTNASLSSPKYALKHAMSANDKVSDATGENLGARGFSFYDNEILTLGESITNDTSFIVNVPNSGISTTNRFKLGSYIQVDNEIMRITSSTLSGSGNDEISVIRGSLGTPKEDHTNGALIRKIKPRAVEFRRPSYVRASGHTFEYLGFGPGNYSTSLPQISTRTLTDKEEYLSQAQEKQCGIVVYTGMNSVGDFFIGNKKVSSSTGKETIFDIPVTTETGNQTTLSGESTQRLSVVFDETIIKERLLVEGGNSGTILSQFDGPVTFNNETKFNDTLTVTDQIKLTGGAESSSTTTGDLVVAGGVGVGGTLTATSIRVTGGITSPTGENLHICPSAGSIVAICTNTTITGILSVTDDITAFWSSDERLKDNITPIEDPLSKVISISGNTFDWNDKSNKSGHDVGLIAQEIEKVLPEAVTTRDNGYLAVDYHKVVPLLVEAIKELSAKVENLENNR
jgi:hypothetical protein